MVRIKHGGKSTLKKGKTISSPKPKYPLYSDVVEERKTAEKKVKRVEVEIVESVKPLSKYDLLRIPINVFDWKNAGVLFLHEANGHIDLKHRQAFADLSDKYEVQNFFIENGLVYFLFKLK